MQINKQETIANIVKQDFRAAQIFSANGLDFCCGGKVPLSEACEKSGLNVENVLEELDALKKQGDHSISYEGWTNAQLIKHIVEVHHAYIEDTVPYLFQLLDKIANVHGERHPELIQIRDIYEEATDALYDHMKKEEMILFPAIESIEQAKLNGKPMPPFPFGSISNPIQGMEGEHDFEGDAFKQIAALSSNFTPPEDACNTYQVAFAKLEEFVNDLHRHIHLENNILFENARLLEQSL
ncbi:MAG: iron-sulfur cluster repair di-iron protein [Reichenbachiella sp.]|uniref:iron-sulfur cluster repair di-iron protein n=1 Tax=Reichenbachiella sp. TaxID=2184521 RepID=UPI0029671AD0|nr:iron-sulfur cluster repair di-iron protein [Reichenbachiella sp.]MDW3209810.1 iron-sulfur cluster repair di-iron protein [Reichenbachiella sp.]